MSVQSQRGNDALPRFISTHEELGLDAKTQKLHQEIFEKIYHSGTCLTSLESSLQHISISSKLMNILLKNSRIKLHDDYTKAVYLYTLEVHIDYAGKIWRGIYQILNHDLRSNDKKQIERWCPYMHYLVRGIIRCPRCPENKTIYRGLLLSNNLIDQNYKAEKIVRWSGFSSCTINKPIAKQFLTDQTSYFKTLFDKIRGRDNQCRTLFELTAKDAYDISSISAYPHEEEVLLLPMVDMKISKIEVRGASFFGGRPSPTARATLSQSAKLQINVTIDYKLIFLSYIRRFTEFISVYGSFPLAVLVFSLLIKLLGVFTVLILGAIAIWLFSNNKKIMKV